MSKVKLDATTNHQDCQKNDETDLSVSDESLGAYKKEKKATKKIRFSKSPTA